MGNKGSYPYKAAPENSIIKELMIGFPALDSLPGGKEGLFITISSACFYTQNGSSL